MGGLHVFSLASLAACVLAPPEVDALLEAALAAAAAEPTASGLEGLFEVGRFGALYAQARHANAPAAGQSPSPSPGSSSSSPGGRRAGGEASSEASNLTAAWCAALWWLGLRARTAASGTPASGTPAAGTGALGRAAAAALARALASAWRLPSVSIARAGAPRVS
jgi:hypothetical protein